jgi:copper(I)-binding protein
MTLFARSTRAALAVATAAVLVAAVSACSSGGGSLSVSDAWVRMTDPAATAAGYLTITNQSSTADSLTGVSSPAYGSAQLHETVVMEPSPSAMASMEPSPSDAMGSMAPSPGASMGDMMGMQPVDEIPVPANGSVELKPGGYHIMLMDPTGTLAIGDTVELTLTFKNAGTITVKATVKGA